MVKFKHFGVRVASVAMLSVVFLSCGNSSADFCSGIRSVADFTNRFSLGLDNFPENEYSQLRLDALDTYDVVMEAARESDQPDDAVRLSLSIQKFIDQMDKVDWDVTRAIQDTGAVEAAATLGSSATLLRANSVEAYVIERCGLPSTLPLNNSIDTLPMPSIPQPTETEPPSDTIDQDSEHFATGMLLATIYGVELSQFEATCLGRELDGVVDVTSNSASSQLYVTQFQKAFDVCEVGFTIPID